MYLLTVLFFQDGLLLFCGLCRQVDTATFRKNSDAAPGHKIHFSIFSVYIPAFFRVCFPDAFVVFCSVSTCTTPPTVGEIQFDPIRSDPSSLIPFECPAENVHCVIRYGLCADIPKILRPGFIHLPIRKPLDILPRFWYSVIRDWCNFVTRMYARQFILSAVSAEATSLIFCCNFTNLTLRTANQYSYHDSKERWNRRCIVSYWLDGLA